jgi:hypothetical protein
MRDRTVRRRFLIRLLRVGAGELEKEENKQLEK